MEREYVTYGLRARATQLMTWLIGPGQNQQRQQMENDRNTRDGISHGEEDPDNRARQAVLGGSPPTSTPQQTAAANPQANPPSRLSFRERLSLAAELRADAKRAPALYRVTLTPQQERGPRHGQVGYDGPDDVRIPRELGPVSRRSDAEIDVAYERAQERAEREGTSTPTQDRLASFKASIADLQDRVVALRAQAPDQSRPQERSRGRGQGMEY